MNGNPIIFHRKQTIQHSSSIGMILETSVSILCYCAPIYKSCLLVFFSPWFLNPLPLLSLTFLQPFHNIHFQKGFMLQQFTFKCKKLYNVNFSLFKNENTGLKQTPATSEILYTFFHCFSHPNFGILNNKCPQHSNGSLNDLHQVWKVIWA